ncbi:MAG: hypothetical protein KJ907_01870 [Actinobacteria bacterium]|nr:hypothetical protein [Actinomycetota bacterium]MBU4401471.1 hypothetical protein [Actinomycetota bacterium]MBU4441388.1 hypothetical protein [Actinomycetota bacterium]
MMRESPIKVVGATPNDLRGGARMPARCQRYGGRTGREGPGCRQDASATGEGPEGRGPDAGKMPALRGKDRRGGARMPARCQRYGGR